jgi:hypothetical protein
MALFGLLVGREGGAILLLSFSSSSLVSPNVIRFLFAAGGPVVVGRLGLFAVIGLPEIFGKPDDYAGLFCKGFVEGRAKGLAVKLGRPPEGFKGF